MRILLNKRNIYHSVFYLVTGLSLLFLWVVPQLGHLGEIPFSTTLMTVLMTVFFFAVGVYALNQVCWLTVDKDGICRKNLLYGGVTLRWDEIRELGQGWYWRRRKSGQMLYLSRKPLTDEGRRTLDDFDLSQGIILSVAESAGRFTPAEEEAIAAVVRFCPGPKTPLFQTPGKYKRDWVRRAQLHYVKREKVDGEMTYTSHTLVGPDPNRKGMI